MVTPVVNPGTFTLSLPATNGQVVGTMTASGSPTTWAITAGNTSGAYAIDNSGVLTVANAGAAGVGAVSLTVQACTGTGPNLYPMFFAAGGGAGDTVTANFGGSAFTGSAPSGFSPFAPAGTWNPSDKTATITLSGGNLIAQSTSGATGGARGNVSASSGKYYLEYTYTTIFTNAFDVGLCNVSANLASNVNTNGMAFVNRTGPIAINNVNTGASLGIIGAGNVIGVAADFGAALIWFRIAPSGNWNGSGTANPATGVGGFDLSPIMPALACGTGTAFITVVSLVPVVTSAQLEVVMPATVGQVIGTVTATGSPTSWTITAGNVAGAYAIDNAGVVTVANPATIVNGVTVLTVQATNASGSGVGTVSLAIPADPPRYLLLVPHYVGGVELAAGAVVAEGVQIPVGWVPTMAVDPQNAEAVVAFWSAGPLPDAEPNRDLYPFVPARQPVVYWRPVPGVADYFVLTGTGAALGTKNAPTPQGPVIVGGAAGWIYPYMLC